MRTYIEDELTALVAEHFPMDMTRQGITCHSMGGLWIEQGLNIIKWPASSFMIGVPRWSWNGLALAIGGLVVMRLSRRIGRG